MDATWPNDVDGDVFRRMEESGFDFSKPSVIDFNIDFDQWPPSKAAVDAVKMQFPNARLVESESEHRGYIQVQVKERVSYDLVMRTQRQVSALVQKFGGVCESWGVMQE